MTHDVLTLRLGFERGLFSRDDVRAWVDAEVVVRGELPAALLALTTVAHQNELDIVARLRELEGEHSPAERLRTELSVLGERYRRGRIAIDDVLFDLYWTGSESEVPSTEECETMRSIYLTFERDRDRAEAERALSAFFERYPFSR